MTLAGIGIFLLLTDRDGGAHGRYQNAALGSTSLDGDGYSYLSFLYRGAARSRTGDNLQAELLLANHPIAMDLMVRATAEKWMFTLTTCAMNPTTFDVARRLSREVWTASTPSYDPETITITLSSALDAIGASVPSVTLTSARVGALPSSSVIRNL